MGKVVPMLSCLAFLLLISLNRLVHGFLSPSCAVSYSNLLDGGIGMAKSAGNRISLHSTKEPKYGGLQHAGILVSDTQRSKAFYVDVFGCLDDTDLRPKTLDYPGAFMRFGNDQIHLMELPSMDPKDGRPEHGGRDRHVALTVGDLDVLRERLEAKHVFYTMSRGGRRALFCRDPDGNAFEFMEDTSIC